MILVTKDIFKIPNKTYFDTINEQVIILENIRYYPEEEKNDDKFAKHLC